MSDFYKRNPYQESDVVWEKPPWSPIELFLDENNQIAWPNIKRSIVNYEKPWFWAAVGMILFNPIFWNIVARNEYKNKTLTKYFGSPYRGTYFLAFTIFSLGIFRDFVYERALRSQPTSVTLEIWQIKYAAGALFGFGQLLVITSIWALGLTGTYLGDYFGILMSHRVTGFPFDIMRDPMYNGSTMCFLATALWTAKPAGLVITGLVYVVYQVALAYEGPFTDKIYSSAANKKSDIAVPQFQSSISSGTSTAIPQTSNPKSSEPSYAAAAAHVSHNANALPNTNPKPIRTISSLGLGAAITSDSQTSSPGKFQSSAEREDSPMRVTRSRSKARIVDDD